jgi:dipeptidyl-peptidase 4
MTNAKIPVEALGAFPLPGMGTPNSFAFDNNRLLFLDGGGAQKLYAVDLESGVRQVLVEPPGGGVNEDNLSPEEELRRQRARMLAVGITHYSRNAATGRLLLPIAGDLYVYDAQDGLQHVLSAGKNGAIQTPRLSPDGQAVAYVQNDEVYVHALDGDEPCQVTTEARGTGKSNGLAEYIAQEELGRSEGFWWSLDSQWIAFTEIDETHIPTYRIMHQGKDTVVNEDHGYPFAGAENAVVRLAVVSRDGGAPVWMDLNTEYEVYIARVFWWRDGSLGAHLLNREQNIMDIVRFDPQTGERTRVHRETNDYWINLRTRYFHMLQDDSFILASERSGYNHLYHYNTDGALVEQLTRGDWVVDTLKAVDEKADMVYFSGNQGNPTETHLYRVPVNGGAVERITSQAGTHTVFLSSDYQYFVDVFDAIDQPPKVTVRALADDSERHIIHQTDDARVQDYDLQPPEIVTLKNHEGDMLYGAVYRPDARFGDGPFPVVVHVYGGPGPQLVTNGWKMTAAINLQYLRQQGFLVFRLDNRGSARRGIRFEGALKHKMGTVEVEDQVDGVRWLVEQGLADPARVGIFGWSYGGYMTLMALSCAADTFKAGVAGAPVVHWDTYDTAYTERYMGTPKSNPKGYADGSVLAHVENLHGGNLLLIHGMIDENVHFRHTARLINALNRARKQYDLLIFPDERHMPRNPADRVYLNERIVQFFQQKL